MNRFKGCGLSIIFVGIISSLIISGCVTTPSTPQTPPDPRMLAAGAFIAVKINSFAAADAQSKGKIYFITSAIQNVSADDLEFQEIARYLENSLHEKGYLRTNNIKGANLLIRLGYGIGNPQTSSETVVTSTGYSYPVGWMWYTVPPQTQTVRNTTYMRSLTVEAYDLKDPKTKSQLWKTTVQSEGTLSDLRIVLAYMIAASMVEIGTNTGQQKDVKIGGHHPNIRYIFK
ncbi:MAG: hypothetical protein A2W27_01165 [Deltaproteobacteria bacterium RBG_16_44_11]|nr:MAG: hypothetical protein A2W27_01165 [Deltaproteobacteria bacterium RBG_16_44_11]